eukprot:scaffold368_cov258-Pinguiococcus_pyrenoidosus.AAC.52
MNGASREAKWPTQGQAPGQRSRTSSGSSDKKNAPRANPQQEQEGHPAGRRVRPRADRNDGDMFMGFLDSVRRSHDSTSTRSRPGSLPDAVQEDAASGPDGLSQPSKKQRITLGGSTDANLADASRVPVKGERGKLSGKLSGNGGANNDSSSETGSSGGSDSLAQQESDATTRESGSNGSGSEDSSGSGTADASKRKGPTADTSAVDGMKPKMREKDGSVAEMDSVDSDDSDPPPASREPAQKVGP